MGIQMLKVHWKAARWPMLPVLVVAFGLPLMAGRSAWDGQKGLTLANSGAWIDVNTVAAFGVVFPFLAFTAGTVLALTAWTWDHNAGHVYPLSLPIERWRYAAMKFGGGVILLAATSTVFFAGASITSALSTLPVGLKAYPGALSIHFFMAGLTAYALMFALAAGTMRTAVLVIAGVFVTFAFGDAILDLAGYLWAPLADIRISVLLYTFLVEGNGPLSVFSGNWMLFDV